jgi:undecaprenyl-diphosphatase
MGVPDTKLRPNRRYLLLVAVLLVALYVLLPQFGGFHSSWHLLRRPVPSWTAAAVALTALTYLAAALTYCLLAFRPLPYGRVFLVQLAAMFINRLLPGGIGALGANYAYLRRSRHSASQAAGVVAVNNLLGALGHALLVAGVLAIYPGSMAIPGGHDWSAGLIAKLAVGLTVLLGVLALVFGRRKFASKASDVRGQLLSYRHRPWRLPAALLSSMLLTLCNVSCLACCALALGVHLPFVAILLVFSLGIGAGTATPTPGGLGGFEAALAAGFIAYHVASPAALAVALLYRLISYWLPLPAGAAAFIICQKRQLFSA